MADPVAGTARQNMGDSGEERAGVRARACGEPCCSGGEDAKKKRGVFPSIGARRGVRPRGGVFARVQPGRVYRKRRP